MTAPKDILAGHRQKIQADRDRKLEASREQWPTDDETDYVRLADNPGAIPLGLRAASIPLMHGKPDLDPKTN
jgi:hypothetical protein